MLTTWGFYGLETALVKDATLRDLPIVVTWLSVLGSGDYLCI